MARLSKGFYLSSPIVSAVGLILASVAAPVAEQEFSSNEISPADAITLLVPLVIGMLSLIYAVIVDLIFFYKIWKAIADEHALTSPAQAIGFLFIPFFNLYWIFEVLWGFAKDCNAYIARHSMNTKKLPERLFLACAFLQLSLGIPYLDFLTALAYLIVFAIVISKTCDAVNAFGQVLAEGGRAEALANGR